MRKLIDSLFVFLLKIIFGYLLRYYDLVVDGVELWLFEKLPSVGDAIEDFENAFIEE